MKKHSLTIYLIVSIIAMVMLALLKVTGIHAHIGIGIVLVLLTIVLTILTARDWKIKPLEIIMRVLLAVAFFSGFPIMNGAGAAVAAVHKIAAVLFIVSVIIWFVANKKNSNSAA